MTLSLTAASIAAIYRYRTLGAIAILLLLANIFPTLPAIAQGNPRSLPSLNPQGLPVRRVTAGMYDRLRPGMTLQEVEATIGFPATPNPNSAYQLEQMYTWSNIDGSGIVVWTVNDRVSMIAKFGLLASSRAPLVSYALLTLIQPGMTESQVEAILGTPGQFRPELFREDWGQAFQWQNSDRSYLTVYFKNGRVAHILTDLLPPNTLKVTETDAQARASLLEIGMTQTLIEQLLGEAGVPYPITLESGDRHVFWRYPDGSLLLIRFDPESEAIAIEPLI